MFGDFIELVGYIGSILLNIHRTAIVWNVCGWALRIVFQWSVPNDAGAVSEFWWAELPAAGISDLRFVILH